MKKLYKSALWLLFFSFTYACYDVIEVDLKDAEPRPVIEAQLFDKYRPATIFLSKSTEFFGTPEFEYITEADITLENDSGKTVNFAPGDSAGLFIANFQGEPGQQYKLNVTNEYGTFTASAVMPEALSIDSLSVISLQHEFGMPGEELGVYCHFTNPPGQRDYVQFRFYKNYEPMPEIYLMDDFYTDGLRFDFFFYSNFVEPLDTVIVEMLSMDADVYDYLYTLSEVAGGSGTGTATPYNPNTNFSGDALGYFGAFGTDMAMIIAEEGAVKVPNKNTSVFRQAAERISKIKTSSTRNPNPLPNENPEEYE